MKQVSDFPKVSLGISPTPVQKLENISRLLNTNVYVKRDDLTGLGLGGNKVRKLEYLMAQAKAEKAEDDPMQGMSVMRAMQVLLDEIDEKGIDMADVNSRIRAKAQELNLSYPSGTILMKAIGYVETRKIALGL